MTAALKKLLIAQIPADLSDWLDFVAIGALLAFTWESELNAFAFWAVAMALPYLIVGPFAGALVDRSNIRNVLILSNIVRGLMTMLLFFAPNWVVLVLLIALRSTVDTFYSPAKQAAIQALTDKDKLSVVNGLSFGINQTSKVIGPAIGGAFLLVLDPQNIFLMNAAVSMLAAGLLFALPNIPKAAAADKASSLMTEVSSGIRYASQTPRLRNIIVLMGAAFFAMFVYDSLISPLTRDLGFDQAILGLSMAAVGAGGVLGAAWFSLSKLKIRPLIYISLGALISALCISTIGLMEITNTPISVVFFLIIFAVIGFCSAMAVIPTRVIIQAESKPEMIGRISALNEAINVLAIMSAPFFGAFLAQKFTIGTPFVVGGFIMLLVSGYALIMHKRLQR